MNTWSWQTVECITIGGNIRFMPLSRQVEICFGLFFLLAQQLAHKTPVRTQLAIVRAASTKLQFIFRSTKANLLIMSAYLLCITVSGGVPLFTRKLGDLKNVRIPRCI